MSYFQCIVHNMSFYNTWPTLYRNSHPYAGRTLWDSWDATGLATAATGSCTANLTVYVVGHWDAWDWALRRDLKSRKQLQGLATQDSPVESLETRRLRRTGTSGQYPCLSLILTRGVLNIRVCRIINEIQTDFCFDRLYISLEIFLSCSHCIESPLSKHHTSAVVFKSRYIFRRYQRKYV